MVAARMGNAPSVRLLSNSDDRFWLLVALSPGGVVLLLCIRLFKECASNATVKKIRADVDIRHSQFDWYVCDDRILVTAALYRSDCVCVKGCGVPAVCGNKRHAPDLLRRVSKP